jgi:hypothetical protein
MAYRVVTGTFLRSDRTPFAGYEVWYTLKPGGFNRTTNYPRNRVVAIVGANGRQHPRNNPEIDGVELWISEEAGQRTEYRTQTPSGEIVEFELYAGVGSVDFSALSLQDLFSGNDNDTDDDANIDALEALLAVHNADPIAHPSLTSGGGGIYRGVIEPGDLSGAIVVINHDLHLTARDVSVSDAEGELTLPWANLGVDHIRLDFGGIAPINQTYNVLIEA